MSRDAPKSLLTRSGWGSALAYSVALASLAGAVLLRWLLDPVLGDTLPLTTLFAAIGVAVWIGGYRPALLVVGLGYLACAYLFIEPRGALGLSEPRNLVGLFLYLVTAAIIIFFGEALARARQNDRIAKKADHGRAEIQSRDVQQQIATMLESVTDGFMRYDRDWRILYVNAEAEKINRLTRSEMLGKILWEVFPALMGTNFEVEFRRAVADRVTIEFENYYEPFGRWYSLKGYPTADGGLTTFIRDITEQKLQYEAVRRSEARLRRVFESNVVGMIRWDLDRSLILEANDTFLQKTGYTRDDVAAGRLNFRDMTPVEWTPRNEEGIREIKEGGYAEPYEKEYFRKDGSRISFIIAGTRFEDSPSEGMSILIDISESKRAEQEIVRLAAESERQRRLYETVLTNTPDFVYVFSLDHKVLYANDALIKMWGRGLEGAIGKTFLEIGYEPWHAEMHDREIDQVRATRQPIRGEVPFNGTSGLRQYDYIFVPIFGADGEVEAVAGTTRDVTERKETERQLREGQEQLDFALAAAELGQWSLNLSDHAASRTLRHDQIFGYDALLPEWTYEMFLEHVVPVDRAAVDANFKESVATGSPWAVECRIRRADGAVRHIWTKGVVRRDAGGQVERMLGIVGDITDLRQAEERRKFFVSLAETLRPLSDPIAVQADASRLLGEHFGANRVIYFEIRDDEYVIERDYVVGVRTLVGRYAVASFGSDELDSLLNGRTVVEADATSNPDRSPEERAAFAGIEVRGHVDVPLVKSGRFVAGMTVQLSVRRDWTPEEVSLIQETAERTWASVQRVRAEAALRRSEERLAFVRRSSGVGFWYCDLPFDVLEWDDLVKAHFHLPSDAEVTIQTFYDRIHPNDRESTRLAIERSIAERTPYNIHYRTVNPDSGVVTWIRAIGRTAYAADGTPICFDGVTLDVSDQKRAEASLKESEQRFRLMADAAPVMIWMSGTDKLVSWCNQPWLAFTGRTMEEEIGEGATEVVHPDDLVRTLPIYLAAFEARAPFTMEYRLRRYDGEFRWMICNGVPRYLADGEFDGYIGSCLDVTDYKNAQATLREADRRKDEFLATLAHELRNPLAPIRNGLQIIHMAGVDGTLEETRLMMERQLGQMVRLVDDLLDVSRVTTGKLRLRMERVALQTVIGAAVETTRPVIEDAGHDLTFVVPDEPIFVEGDATRLAQVVSNLLNNSAKYTHRGGQIRLTLHGEEGRAVVEVADNGIGIPPEMVGEVFEMFTQVNRSLEKTTGGLGIGLSLVKGLVEMHGGTIEARSDGEGRGSAFIVRLPAAVSVAQSLKPSVVDESIGSIHRRRILVADDNVDSATSLGRLLKLLGNEVRTANDGLQAVDTAEEFQPDVIILDIGMPNLDGFEVCSRIRKQPWGKNAVLVAMTGWGQDEDKRRSKEAGFDIHLVKPVDFADIKKLLSSLKTEVSQIAKANPAA